MRSLTVESNAVVDAIVDPKATNADRGAKFRAAAQVHSDLHKNPRVGQGLHRHLFALYLLIRGFKCANDHHSISQPMHFPSTLSTCHSPHNQSQGRWDRNGKDGKMIWPGQSAGWLGANGRCCARAKFLLTHRMVPRHCHTHPELGTAQQKRRAKHSYITPASHSY